MKERYIIQIAAEGSVKEDIEKTIDAIKKNYNVTELDVADEVCDKTACSSFIDVVIEGNWQTHFNFAKLFAPTVVEPVDGLDIEATDFFKPMMKMVAQSRILLSGTSLKIPVEPFKGPVKYDEYELEELLLSDNVYRVNIVYSIQGLNPMIFLGALQKAVTINDFQIREQYVGIDAIGTLTNISMIILYFLPVAVEPVWPTYYSLQPLEVADVLMLISDRSREIINIKIEETREHTNRKILQNLTHSQFYERTKEVNNSHGVKNNVQHNT